MSFYLINQDPESPIMAIKSSHLASLELVFKKRECSKWVGTITEWFEDKGSFRAVWQRGDELRIRTIAFHDDHSFESLFSHSISEQDIEALLKTLVNRNCLGSQYKQDMFNELTNHFAIMRLASLQKQAKVLLEQLVEGDMRGYVYLNKVGMTERFSITSESKKNILTSIKQLKQMIDIIAKMMSDKKTLITKEEITLFRTFKSSCYIKSESPLGNGWFEDKAFADELAVFVQDFDSFLASSLARSLSEGVTRFGLYKPNSEQKLLTQDIKPSWKTTCTIL